MMGDRSFVMVREPHVVLSDWTSRGHAVSFTNRISYTTCGCSRLQSAVGDNHDRLPGHLPQTIYGSRWTHPPQTRKNRGIHGVITRRLYTGYGGYPPQTEYGQCCGTRVFGFGSYGLRWFTWYEPPHPPYALPRGCAA